jgi:hypothetical protein
MGTMHRYHPRNDEEPAILYDDCERCAEHAAHPLDSLDDRFLTLLWEEMKRVEASVDGFYRNGNEARACRQLASMRRLGKLGLL